MKTESPITWLQVNNWVPIIISIVTLSCTFGAVLTRLALIEQKQDTIAQQQKTMIDLFKNTENRYGELALKVKRLETLRDIDE